jgi:ribosome-binding factor A
MPTYRRERAGDFIREQFTLLLRDHVHDPRVQSLIITDVELTKDRRLARVYVACYDGDEVLHKGLEGLESAKSFFRRSLSQILGWRFVPEIEFRVDRSWQYGTRIDALLRDIEEQDAEQAGEPEEGDKVDDARVHEDEELEDVEGADESPEE